MIGSHRVEGYAIVSADDMIADAGGEMPETIRNPADQAFLQSELDKAAVVVHGRHSYEGGPHASRRKRLILTRRTASLAPDPSLPNAWLWNPAGMTLAAAITAIGAGDGVIAIIGGTDVFGLFLPQYDTFHLTRAGLACIPGGRPLFPEVGHGTRAEDVLLRRGLKAGPCRNLDAASAVTLTTWRR